MGFFDLYRCPNTKCWWDKKGKKGQFCPECGTELIKLANSNEGLDLARAKFKLKKDPETISRKEYLRTDEGREEEREFKKEQREIDILNRLLFKADAEDEDIISSIESDMHNLASHEAGTKWMRIGTLLTLNVTDQIIGAGFKAIIDQNKILIKQNELIYRELKKINEK
jgi:hypothetical protein